MSAWRQIRIATVLGLGLGAVSFLLTPAHSQGPGIPSLNMPSAGSGGPPGIVPSGLGAGGAEFHELQQQEAQLGQQARALLQSYAAESDVNAKTGIKNSLRVILLNQFDLQHQRRDGELKKIEKRLADLRSKLSKRSQAKNTIVDRRLEQLVSDVDGLGWGADDIPQELFDSSAGGSMLGGGPMMGPSAGMMGLPASSAAGAPPRGRIIAPSVGTPERLSAPAIPAATPAADAFLPARTPPLAEPSKVTEPSVPVKKTPAVDPPASSSEPTPSDSKEPRTE